MNNTPKPGQYWFAERTDCSETWLVLIVATTKFNRKKAVLACICNSETHAPVASASPFNNVAVWFYARSKQSLKEHLSIQLTEQLTGDHGSRFLA